MARKLLLSFLLIFTGYIGLNAQLVVPQKPEPPQMRKQLPAPADDSFVLVPAEWAVKGEAYYYVQPRYVKQRPGMKHVPGKWKKVKGGWMWKAAEWKEA
ncbi:MAG: hypothetical protein AAF597_05680 [Bacteroidota bacterium]